MKLSLMSIRLINFKGVKDNTYVFDGVDSIVSGKNASGKTSIMSAWMWLTCDKDADLHSNPNIRPIDVEECTPRVEAVVDIDGTTVNLAKQQKRSVSKPNSEGVSKITLANSYEINSVPKSERDFKTYLTELGVDFDLILPLSHADVFTSQKANDMRKVLFGMVGTVSDKEIVDKIPGLTMLPQLISHYTVEEITAMQKATLRKINEDYGKDGEILRAKIEGLESAKIDVDVASMELGKADATRRLSEIKAKINDATAMTEDYEKLSTDYYNAKNALFEIDDEYKRTHKESVGKLENRINEIKREIKAINADKENYDSVLIRVGKLRDTANERLEKSREEYRKVSRETFDEESAVCPTCGRKYPDVKITDMKAAFEDSLSKRLLDIKAAGEANLKSVNDSDEVIADTSKRIDECNTKLAELLAEEDTLIDELSKVREVKSVGDTEEYRAALSKMENLKTELDKMTNSRREVVNELRDEEFRISEELTGYEKALAANSNNENIDVQVETLRGKQITYEQNRADAEAILYEIDLLSKRKNELLTDEINSHFRLVEFVLFDYLKNGTYTDCCKVTLGGKTLGESTNTGCEMLAKLDIINGLQNFYGESYPVFLDGAECLSEETMNRINIEAQLIMLTVSECGLTVKER